MIYPNDTHPGMELAVDSNTKEPQHAGEILHAFDQVKRYKGKADIERSIYATLKRNANHENPYKIDGFTIGQKEIFTQLGSHYRLNGTVEILMEAIQNNGETIDFSVLERKIEQLETAIPQEVLFAGDELADGGKSLLNHLADAVTKEFSQYEADAIMACLGVKLAPEDKDPRKRVCQTYLHKHHEGYQPGTYKLPENGSMIR